MTLLIVSFLINIFILFVIIFLKKYHISFSGDYIFNTPQKIHNKIVARIGGLSLYLTLIIVYAIFSDSSSGFMEYLKLLLICSVPIFVGGLNEDIFKCNFIIIRILLALFSVLLFFNFVNIYNFNFEFKILNILFSNIYFYYIFFSIAIIGLSNSYNLIDGLNGLCGMLALFVLLSLLYVSISVDDYSIVPLLFILIGSLLSLLIFNFPKSYIYFGDSGAYLFGFAISIITIMLIGRNIEISPWFGIAINSFTVFETILTICRRLLKSHKIIFTPDNLHIHSLIYKFVCYYSTYYYHNKIINKNSISSLLTFTIAITNMIPSLFFWNNTQALIYIIISNLIIYISFYILIFSFIKRKKL